MFVPRSSWAAAKSRDPSCLPTRKHQAPNSSLSAIGLSSSERAMVGPLVRRLTYGRKIKLVFPTHSGDHIDPSVPPNGVLVSTLCGGKHILILVAKRPPPGYDQEKTIEGPWIAKCLETLGHNYNVEFNPEFDHDYLAERGAEHEDEDETDLVEVRDDGEDDDDQGYPQRRNRASLAERILMAALPTILQIAEPSDRPYQHPCYILDHGQLKWSNPTPRTAYQFFYDTAKLQLVTRDGKLEVIQGHHEGPIDIAPFSPTAMRRIGFCDFDEIASFSATNIFLSGPYESGGFAREGRWFSATGPDLGEHGAICAMAEPGTGDECDLQDELKWLASIRNADLDEDSRILPLKGVCNSHSLPL